MDTQPQLFQIALDKKDIVYTPDWVARDMIDFFKPSGRILEPSSGDGAFLKYLPGADWCEIEQGRDFFFQNGYYDWIVGNPPYSQLSRWLEYTFCHCDNSLYLIPMNSPFNSMKRMRMILGYGGFRAIRAYGDGVIFGKEYSFAVGAFWFQKDYHGLTDISLFEEG